MMIKNEKGVSAVIVVLLLVVLLGIGALAIDIGYLACAKNECQNAADAAALAGARQLGENYANKTDLSYNVKTVAATTAGKNKAAGQPVVLDTNNIELGTWDPATSQFTETGTNATAVWVKTTATPSTFFAKIFSILNMNVVTEACAIIGGPCEGEADIPFWVFLRHGLRKTPIPVHGVDNRFFWEIHKTVVRVGRIYLIQ